MNINNLVHNIIDIHDVLQSKATSAINSLLTIRNWIIGYYIVEYEQKGSDKAEYGQKVLKKLSKELKGNKLKSVDERELRRFRLFYQTYPQFQSLFLNQDKQIRGMLSPILDSVDFLGKKSTYNEYKEKLIIPSDILIENLSFSHFVELIKMKNNLKRSFYEIECIKGTWSINELRRQVSSLYFERSGLSLNKEKLSELASINAEVLTPSVSLKNPMIFEFLNLPLNETIEENQLEKAIMDNLQSFLLELGYGFCFESRQKRILIDDEYFYVDMVFYHRILKCHVLIELKAESFNYQNTGQLNTYLQYFKNKVMQKNDNPPIGILLCTGSKPQMVKYALADKENMLVSQYKLKLPSEADLQNFIQSQIERSHKH